MKKIILFILIAIPVIAQNVQIQYEHDQIHKGNVFGVYYYSNGISITSNIGYLIKADSKTQVSFSAMASVTGNAYFSLKENVLVSNIANFVTNTNIVYNMNFNSTRKSKTMFLRLTNLDTNSITNYGTTVFYTVIDTTGNSTVSLGGNRFPMFVMLKTNVWYYLELLPTGNNIKGSVGITYIEK